MAKDKISSKDPIDATVDKTSAAFQSAFDAMTQWRDEINDSTKQHGEAVFDKLGVAARAAGWPESLIETTKTQLMQASKLQTDMIEHMMAAWKDQLNSPSNPSKLMGSLGQGASMPGQMPDVTNLVMVPTQFWMQATTMWQKNWSDAMSIWMGGGKPPDQRDPNSR